MEKARVVRFTVSIPCKIPFSHEVKEYEDFAFIILPDGYSEDGAPVRLVINCHGAGGTVTTDDSQVENQAMTQYLVANGYAVMGVNGLPEAYADTYGIDIRNNIGCPISIESNVRAYQYCMERFHLLPEVIILGSSMGGITSTNLVLSHRIPVLAQVGFCPVLDTYNEIFLHPWCDGLPKTALGMFYSLDRDSDGNWLYDEEKIQGQNPVQNPARLHYPCPVFFCQCANDHVVSPEVTKLFVEEVNSAGGRAELMLLPDGWHEPQLYGAGVSDPMGNTQLDGQTLEIRPGVEAAYRFIRQFG